MNAARASVPCDAIARGFGTQEWLGAALNDNAIVPVEALRAGACAGMAMELYSSAVECNDEHRFRTAVATLSQFCREFTERP